MCNNKLSSFAGYKALMHCYAGIDICNTPKPISQLLKCAQSIQTTFTMHPNNMCNAPKTFKQYVQGTQSIQTTPAMHPIQTTCAMHLKHSNNTYNALKPIKQQL